MPRRKLLKGIASGLASSFASRNNDADGYWTIGILYKVANDLGTNKFTIALATGESKPSYKYSERIAASYYHSLIEIITKLGFKDDQVQDVVIEIEFNLPSAKSQSISEWSTGAPFICRAMLTDDLNRVWSSEFRGWCRQHDPKKERRSVRRFS